MLYRSKLPEVPVPSTDVFNYLFHVGRRTYPRSRVLYRVDDTGETINLAQLEEKCRRFASAVTSKFQIKAGDTIAVFASDSVNDPFDLTV